MKGQNYSQHGSRVDSEGRGCSGNPQSPIRWDGGIVEGNNGERGAGNMVLEVPGERGGGGEKRRKQVRYPPVGAGKDPAYLRHSSWSLFF